MNNFKTEDTVEALDEFGVWAKGTIVAMDGEKLRVSFEGFGSMWNRSVSEEEIRRETIAELPKKRSREPRIVRFIKLFDD